MILQAIHPDMSLANLVDPIYFGFDDVDMPLDTPTLITELAAATDGVLNTPISRESKGNFSFAKSEMDPVGVGRSAAVVRHVKPGEFS